MLTFAQIDERDYRETLRFSSLVGAGGAGGSRADAARGVAAA
jgi:hypothetical protein